MACIVRGRIPADEFALYETSSSISSVEYEVERVVENGEGVVMPLVWIRGPDDSTLQESVANDSSVQELSLLGEFDTGLLYHMEWTEDVEVVLQILTASEATILSAYGAETQWTFRVLYPTREAAADTHEYCDEQNLTFEMDMIRDFAGEPAGRYGLTDEQFAVIRMAAKRGYFSIPREITLGELAEELGISHQAVSERLRRAHEVLIRDTVLVGAGPDSASES